MRCGLALRSNAQLQANDHAVGKKRGAGDMAAAQRRGCGGTVSCHQSQGSLLHHESEDDEGSVAACAAEEKLCKPRDDPACGG